MRLVHTHDPEPRDARILSNEEITSAIVRTHVRMWEFASLGEFQLAGVCEREPVTGCWMPCPHG
jgi:hypothetical protein